MNNFFKLFFSFILSTILFSCSKKTKTFTEVICNGKSWNVTESEIKFKKSDNTLISKTTLRSFKFNFHSNNTATRLQGSWLLSDHRWFENGNIMIIEDDGSFPFEFNISDKLNETSQIWVEKNYKASTTTTSNLEWSLTQ